MSSTRPREMNNISSSTPSLNNINKSFNSNNSQLELSYYESEQMSRKVGTIALEKCEEVLSHLHSSSFQHVFAIKTFKSNRPRTYFLASDSEKDMSTWVAQLCKYLKMIHENPLNRYSNRSSAGPNSHHQVQTFPLSVFPSIASLSTTALDGRGLNRTPTLVKKPMSTDYTDEYSLSSLPRNATLTRLNSFSRNTPHSPHVFYSNPPPPTFNPHCPPPSDYHEFLPLLLTPINTLPRSKLHWQTDQKLSTTEEKNFVYFTESVTQLLQLQNQIDKNNERPPTISPSYYDTPTKKYNNESDERHFYHNRVSEFYDFPCTRAHDRNIYSKEKLEGDKDFEGKPEYYASLPEGNTNGDAKALYSVPCKMKNFE